MDQESHDLSLQEAARVYDVSASTLARRIRWGQVPAYKARGPWGQEWRVSPGVLESLGYRPRPAAVEDEGSRDPRLAGLERELAAMRRVVAAERHRADHADRELGYALLECGRLRSALARAAAARERCEQRGSADVPVG